MSDSSLNPRPSDQGIENLPWGQIAFSGRARANGSGKSSAALAEQKTKSRREAAAQAQGQPAAQEGAAKKVQGEGASTPGKSRGKKRTRRSAQELSSMSSNEIAAERDRLVEAGDVFAVLRREGVFASCQNVLLGTYARRVINQHPGSFCELGESLIRSMISIDTQFLVRVQLEVNQILEMRNDPHQQDRYLEEALPRLQQIEERILYLIDCGTQLLTRLERAKRFGLVKKARPRPAPEPFDPKLNRESLASMSPEELQSVALDCFLSQFAVEELPEELFKKVKERKERGDIDERRIAIGKKFPRPDSETGSAGPGVDEVHAGGTPPVRDSGGAHEQRYLETEVPIDRKLREFTERIWRDQSGEATGSKPPPESRADACSAPTRQSGSEVVGAHGA